MQNNVAFPDRNRHGIAYSPEAKDIIQLLLKKDKTQRLGRNGLDEVLSHRWFADLDRHDMAAKKIPSPYNHKQKQQELGVVKKRVIELKEKEIGRERKAFIHEN